MDLDVDKLCFSDNMFSDSIKRVMRDWELTNSPLWTYWGNLLRDDSQFGEKNVIPEDREKKHCPGRSDLILHWKCKYYLRPICRKVLKIMFWEVPPADWLIL